MTFIKDVLERQKFADILISLTTSLASTPILPAGRVIAVDAPWGAGKSWVATKLPDHFNANNQIGKCVYVDAFEFDFHQDPFAVVTSAILEAYSTDNIALRNFKTTAVDVIRASIPAVGKGLIKTSGKLIGIDTDEVYESIVDAGSEASEKSIEKMLDTFSKTKATTSKFKEKLSKLVQTNSQDKPLVVVIDELDRCRPSFALEMLERVKHLFDVPNVVFIFFVHTPALYSAIRKTYGNDISPSEYLRKFIAITIGLPVADKSTSSPLDQENFFRRFIDAQYPANTTSHTEVEFRESLAIFATFFHANFRDIESIMLLWQILKGKNKNLSLIAAYCFFIRIKDPIQFSLLKNSQQKACANELARLGEPLQYENSYISYIRDMFIYCSDTKVFENTSSANAKMLRTGKTIRDNHNDVLIMNHALNILELEYIRI